LISAALLNLYAIMGHYKLRALNFLVFCSNLSLTQEIPFLKIHCKIYSLTKVIFC